MYKQLQMKEKRDRTNLRLRSKIGPFMSQTKSGSCLVAVDVVCVALILVRSHPIPVTCTDVGFCKTPDSWFSSSPILQACLLVL